MSTNSTVTFDGFTIRDVKLYSKTRKYMVWLIPFHVSCTTEQMPRPATLHIFCRSPVQTLNYPVSSELHLKVPIHWQYHAGIIL